MQYGMDISREGKKCTRARRMVDAPSDGTNGTMFLFITKQLDGACECATAFGSGSGDRFAECARHCRAYMYVAVTRLLGANAKMEKAN